MTTHSENETFSTPYSSPQKKHRSLMEQWSDSNDRYKAQQEAKENKILNHLSIEPRNLASDFEEDEEAALSFEEKMEREAAAEVIQRAVRDWREKRHVQSTAPFRKQAGFDFAEKIFALQEIPLGSELKYISALDQELAPAPKKETEEKIIFLGEGMGYLSSIAPEKDTGVLMGVIKPQDSEILYYYPDADEEDKRLKMPLTHSYSKLNLTENSPFEVYLRDVALPLIDSKKRESMTLLTNRDGQEFVRMRERFLPLKELWEIRNDLQENLHQLSEFSSTKKGSSVVTLRLAEERRVLKDQEKYAEQACNSFVDAMTGTSKMAAYLYNQPYCEQNVYHDRRGYIDRIVPYLGKNLETLLEINRSKDSISKGILHEERKLEALRLKFEPLIKRAKEELRTLLKEALFKDIPVEKNNEESLTLEYLTQLANEKKILLTLLDDDREQPLRLGESIVQVSARLEALQEDEKEEHLSSQKHLDFANRKLQALSEEENGISLTPEYRIEIAKQCIALVCSLYDESLYDKKASSSKWTSYFHGNISLKSFCVQFKEDNLGKIVPVVNLVGLEQHSEGYVRPTTYSAYTAPEVELPTRGNKPKPFTTDIYALGVVLEGFVNSVRMPTRTRHQRIGKVDPRAWFLDQEISLLSPIDPALLKDPIKIREYTDLVMLARDMKNPEAIQRPNLMALKVGANIFPAVIAINKELALAHEKNQDPAQVEELQLMAKKAVGLMKALAEYKAHHKAKDQQSYWGWLGLGKTAFKKTIESSQAILNATQASLFNHELESLIAEGQDSASERRNSFTPFLLKALEESGVPNNAAKRACQELIVNLSVKYKPSPVKQRRPSDTETADETMESGVTAEIGEKRSVNLLRSNNKIVPSR